MKSNLSQSIVNIGREAWNLGLVAGRSGNISLRREDRVIITKSGTCLGMLGENDFSELDLAGKTIKGDKPSSETPLHLAIYNNTSSKVVVHLHPPFSSAYFSSNDQIKALTFEEKLVLGQVPVVEQHTPTVTDIQPVLEAFKTSNVVVLKNHGVISIGENLLDAFFLIQTLEQAVKMELVYRLTSGSAKQPDVNSVPIKQPDSQPAVKYILFSRKQIEKIVDLVNHDEVFLKQAQNLNLTLTMAIKLEETKEVFRFNFVKGKITELTNSEDAEFVVSGSRAVWEAIFRRQIDPFVATTQKKLNLKGDFAKLSKWYAPFARLFQLWQQAPIE